MNGKKILYIGGRVLFPALALTTSLIEVFRETELPDKADDFVFLGLALCAFLWAIFAKSKTPKYFPVVFLLLALITKIIALFVEGDDAKAVDPDYLVLIFMALGVMINAGAQFFLRRKGQ